MGSDLIVLPDLYHDPFSLGVKAADPVASRGPDMLYVFGNNADVPVVLCNPSTGQRIG